MNKYISAVSPNMNQRLSRALKPGTQNLLCRGWSVLSLAAMQYWSEGWGDGLLGSGLFGPIIRGRLNTRCPVKRLPVFARDSTTPRLTFAPLERNFVHVYERNVVKNYTSNMQKHKHHRPTHRSEAQTPKQAEKPTHMSEKTNTCRKNVPDSWDWVKYAMPRL